MTACRCGAAQRVLELEVELDRLKQSLDRATGAGWRRREAAVIDRVRAASRAADLACPVVAA